MSAPTPVELDHTDIALVPDPSRVVLRFFVPGREDVGPGDSRAGSVIDRVLALDEAEVAAELAEVMARFDHRHRHLLASFELHATGIDQRLDDASALSTSRRRLLGAVFSHEYAIEGAALCNPSIVAHPEQPTDGSTAFVLSTRCIGEGHRSSIGFRTGSVSADGDVQIDRPGGFAQIGTLGPGTHHKAVLHRKLAELHDDHENAAFVLDPLPDHFGDHHLHERVAILLDDAVTRRHAADTAAHLHILGCSSYVATFPTDTDLSERVLWPTSPIERHGMEDARFVEVVDGSAPRYCATYTAFVGTNIAQNLLTTEDFRSFEVTPMAGIAARGKGLALFPRQIDGRYVALSRADRETNSVAWSDDLLCWDSSTVLQTSEQPWELVQLGNCGSPIETDEGWLVLTHGVGAVRTYAIGALLLDLDDPSRVIATGTEPILRPTPDGRDGYVPNVVYTCGALAIGDRLVLPYGIGDQTIAVATLSIRDLIGSMNRR
jgi:predicted GH43/DUF377 family glycosyl hydrolase